MRVGDRGYLARAAQQELRQAAPTGLPTAVRSRLAGKGEANPLSLCGFARAGAGRDRCGASPGAADADGHRGGRCR